MAQIQPPTHTLDPKLINFYAEKLHLCRVVQFGVQSKVWVCKLSRILTNPKNAVCELLKVRRI